MSLIIFNTKYNKAITKIILIGFPISNLIQYPKNINNVKFYL